MKYVTPSPALYSANPLSKCSCTNKKKCIPSILNYIFSFPLLLPSFSYCLFHLFLCTFSSYSIFLHFPSHSYFPPIMFPPPPFYLSFPPFSSSFSLVIFSAHSFLILIFLPSRFRLFLFAFPFALPLPPLPSSFFPTLCFPTHIDHPLHFASSF